MQYTITNPDNRYFEVANELQQPVGDLQFATLPPSEAQIKTRDGNVYDITIAGFWQTRKKITKNGADWALLKPNWGNGFILSFDNGRSLSFKKKSQWKNGHYILADAAGNEIAAIYADFVLSDFKIQYEIDTNTTISDGETNTVLPLLLIYCAKIMIMRQ